MWHSFLEVKRSPAFLLTHAKRTVVEVEADLWAVQSWPRWRLTSGEVNTALSAERGLSAALLAAEKKTISQFYFKSLTACF